MAGRIRTLLILGGLLVLLGVGFLYLRAPKPIIEIKAEPLWTVGPVEITNTLFTSWIVVIIIIVGAFLVTRRIEMIPKGWQNAVEGVIEVLYGLVVATAGERHARRFFPVIATIFLYVIMSNWFGLMPFFNVVGKFEEVTPHHFREDAVVFEKQAGLFVIKPGAEDVELKVDETACAGLAGAEKDGCVEEARAGAIAHAREDKELSEGQTLGIVAPYFRGVNTDLRSPLSLAIASAIFVEYWGISTLGLMGYGSRFLNFRRLMKGNPIGIIDVFVGVLEFIAEIARLISFTFRLFGNMLAGEILLLMMTFLIPLLLALPFYGLELFVGAIQAFVFAMLTLVFGALAVTGHGDEHEERHEAHAAPVEAAQPAE